MTVMVKGKNKEFGVEWYGKSYWELRIRPQKNYVRKFIEKKIRKVKRCISQSKYILVGRVLRVNKGLIDDEQRSFRWRNGCVDQTFTLRQINEETGEETKDVYIGFMDLEKGYDREALWQVLRMYVVGGELLNEIKSMYVNILSYVRVKVGQNECCQDW